jgi:hypothetical protein
MPKFLPTLSKPQQARIEAIVGREIARWAQEVESSRQNLTMPSFDLCSHEGIQTQGSKMAFSAWRTNSKFSSG